MFTKILIANRGEIACRVIKTAKKLGIKTVAVYSEADKRRAPCRTGRRVGAARPRAFSRESYLVADKIIAAAKADRRSRRCIRATASCRRTRPSPSAVEDEGIVFIGPQATTQHRGHGRQDRLEEARQARPRSTPSPAGTRRSTRPSRRSQIAKDIGYPVMIKASRGRRRQGPAGGLQRPVRPSKASRPAATRRATSFGDDRVFIEKYVRGAAPHRDPGAGRQRTATCVYLNERECSIQRRHQKVIEEAPSPFISDATRKRDGRAGGGAWPRR